MARRQARSARYYLIGAVLAPPAAVATYLHGLWSGHFLDLRGRMSYCGPGEPATRPEFQGWVPLSHQCRWRDGSATELVPGYVNPVIVGCLVAMVVLLVLAQLAHRRAGATAPAGSAGSAASAADTATAETAR
ncbi:hypothetical protein ACFZB9_18450 [Kitasatospora sp. NPDC008050]|uniref:hypothetical protein n=1 Tax=Kitasatospora sp. NPDC008050 TaxID=3364021 RepID=UPI0036ED5D38